MISLAPTMRIALPKLPGLSYPTFKPTLCRLSLRAIVNNAYRIRPPYRSHHTLKRFRSQILPRPGRRTRSLATVSHFNPDNWGPIQEYDERVHSRQLRDDEHQRSIIHMLQDLHDMLRDYHAPKVVHPSIESLRAPKKSFISSLFHPKPRIKRTQLPENLPKGLYMFGDVGSGKTMLMDLFYDTLPSNITSKTRIHFHNFMQDAHKRLHAIKLQHGTDLDAVKYVAADIAEKGSVLCFDEFQCTDVADAMILRSLLEALMSHGVVLVTTSNRRPDDLYKNGIQRGILHSVHQPSQDAPSRYQSRLIYGLQEDPTAAVRSLSPSTRQSSYLPLREVVQIPGRFRERSSTQSYAPGLGSGC